MSTGLKELLPLVLGIISPFLTALRHVPERWKTTRMLHVLVFCGIAGQVLTQSWQYYNAGLNFKLGQNQVERDAAVALFAYTYAYTTNDREPDLLEAVAPSDRYTLGYLHFRKKQYDNAKTSFDSAIKEGTFVAPSHYMLAVMIWNRYYGAGFRGDLSEAFSHVHDAISYDAKYASPYYLRAILRWYSNQEKAALEDLGKAVDIGPAPCYILNDPREISAVWERGLASSVEYGSTLKRLQDECAVKHHLENAVKKLRSEQAPPLTP